MSAPISTLLAGIPCRFASLGGGPLGEPWQWKLDPYRASSDLGERGAALWVRRLPPGEAPTVPRQRLHAVHEGFFLREVWDLADGGTLWRYLRRQSGEVLLVYRVSPDWSEITLLEDHTQTGGQVAFEYLCHLFPACVLGYGLLTLHGVLMEHRNRGVILSAPSGTGKTTHARLWRDRKNALILNGDRAACRKVDGVWTGFGLPWSGTSGEQINRSVPLRAVVVLERGEENEAFPVSALDAFGAVLPQVLCPTWDAALTETAMGLLDDFLACLPVLRLRCRPDAEAADVLERALEEWT